MTAVSICIPPPGITLGDEAFLVLTFVSCPALVALSSQDRFVFIMLLGFDNTIGLRGIGSASLNVLVIVVSLNATFLAGIAI